MCRRQEWISGDMSRLSTGDAGFLEILITTGDVWSVMTNCTRKLSPELDDLPFQLYFQMTDLLGDLLPHVYRNWLRRIPRAVSRRVVVLLKNYLKRTILGLLFY